MRHGGINELLGVSLNELREAVMEDIELVWVRSN